MEVIVMKTTTLFIVLGVLFCALGSVLMIANSINTVPNVTRNGLIIFLGGLAIVAVSTIISFKKKQNM